MRGTALCRSVAVVACLLLVAGCHAATAGAPPSSPSSPDPLASRNTSALSRLAAPVRDYLRAITSDQPKQVRSAASRAATGSPAATYAEHRANRMQAQLGGAWTLYPSTVKTAANGPAVRLCNRARSSCLRLGDFSVGRSVKVRTFTVDGQPIGRRLVAGNGRAVHSALGDVTVLTAYDNPRSHRLEVTLRIRAGHRPVSPRLYRARFESEAGTRHTAVGASGTTDIAAGSAAVVEVMFPAAPPRGQVTVGLCGRRGCAEHERVTVDVP